MTDGLKIVTFEFVYDLAVVTVQIYGSEHTNKEVKDEKMFEKQV